MLTLILDQEMPNPVSDADNDSDSDSEGHSVEVQVEMDIRIARAGLATRMRATRPYTTTKRRARDPNKVAAEHKDQLEGDKVYKEKKVKRDESRLARAVQEEQRLPRLKEEKQLTKLAVPSFPMEFISSKKEEGGRVM